MKKCLVCILTLLLIACGSSEDTAQQSNSDEIAKPSNEVATVNVAKVKGIIEQRCATCHSAEPNDDVFRAAPSNVMLDTLEQMQRASARIYARSVATQTMPFMNKTQMTEEERTLIKQWVKAGAPIQ